MAKKNASGGRISASGNVNSGVRPIASQPSMPSHPTAARASGMSSATAGPGMAARPVSGKPKVQKMQPKAG